MDQEMMRILLADEDVQDVVAFQLTNAIRHEGIVKATVHVEREVPHDDDDTEGFFGTQKREEDYFLQSPEEIAKAIISITMRLAGVPV